MNKRTRKLTLTALMSALTIVFLYIAAVFPTGQLGFVAVASLFGIAAVIEGGLISGLLVFVISALLGFLIIPTKTVLLSYVLFFGYYPVLKSLIERIRKLPIEWVLKLVLFNGALTAFWFLFRELVFSIQLANYGTAVVYIIGNVVFIIFDFGVSKMIGFYIARISKNLKK
jgi:hypothetical protein